MWLATCSMARVTHPTITTSALDTKVHGQTLFSTYVRYCWTSMSGIIRHLNLSVRHRCVPLLGAEVRGLSHSATNYSTHGISLSIYDGDAKYLNLPADLQTKCLSTSTRAQLVERQERTGLRVAQAIRLSATMASLDYCALHSNTCTALQRHSAHPCLSTLFPFILTRTPTA